LQWMRFLNTFSTVYRQCQRSGTNSATVVSLELAVFSTSLSLCERNFEVSR